MAERLTGSGISPVDSVEYTATIHDTDWVGALTDIDVAHGGIIMSWDAEGTDNRHAPIMGCTATVDIVVEVGDTTLETFLEDLRTSVEGRFWLTIESDGLHPVLFRGIVIPDNGYDSDQGARFNIKIAAVDGIALLKKKPYYNDDSDPVLYTGSNNLVTHLVRCLLKLPHTALWGTTEEFLETSLDWWPFGATSGGSNDPLFISYVDNACFYDFHTKGSIDRDVLSCYDVIKNILVAFGARMIHFAGRYKVEQIDYRQNTTYEFRQYDKSADLVTSGGYASPNTINQTRFGAKISYATFDYIPQIRQTRVTYAANLRRNFWGNIFLAESVTYNFNQEISSNSGAATFRIRGNFHVNIERISGYTGNPQDIIFAEMRLTLKIGSNYLKRNGTYANFAWHPEVATWTASSSDAMVIVGAGQQVPQSAGLASSYIFSFDIITPPLPSDGSTNAASATFSKLKRNNNEEVDESEFEISWSAGSMWMEVYDLGTPDVQEDEVLYVADNPSGGTDVYETETRLGGGSANYAGRIMNSSNVPYTLWGAGSGTRDKTLGTLLANTILNGQLRAIKRMNATIRGTFDPMKLMRTSEPLDWMLMRGDWSMTENLISGSWFEVDYGEDATPATPVKIKIIQGGTVLPQTTYPPIGIPTNNGNQGFSQNAPPTILAPIAYNSLAASIVKDDVITSIDIVTPSAGNEFNVGDTITVINPITGQYQDFIVDAVPMSGDTSFVINSATVLFDSPIGSYMVIKQKAFSLSFTEYDSDESAAADGVVTGGWYVASDSHTSLKGGTLTQNRIP